MNMTRRYNLPVDCGAQADNTVPSTAKIERAATSVNEAAVLLTENEVDPFVKVVQPARPSLTYERVE